MADQSTDSGLRFNKVASWAPPIIMVLGLVFLAVGELLVGLLLTAAAIVYWVVVRRRKQPSAGSDPAGT